MTRLICSPRDVVWGLDGEHGACEECPKRPCAGLVLAKPRFLQIRRYLLPLNSFSFVGNATQVMLRVTLVGDRSCWARQGLFFAPNLGLKTRLGRRSRFGAKLLAIREIYASVHDST